MKRKLYSITLLGGLGIFLTLQAFDQPVFAFFGCLVFMMLMALAYFHERDGFVARTLNFISSHVLYRYGLGLAFGALATFLAIHGFIPKTERDNNDSVIGFVIVFSALIAFVASLKLLALLAGSKPFIPEGPTKRGREQREAAPSKRSP